MAGADAECRGFHVRDVAGVTFFEDVPIIDGCPEPQSQAPCLGGSVDFAAAGGCSVTVPPMPCGASSQAAPQQPLLLPPHKAFYAQPSWDGAHTVGSVQSNTKVHGLEAQRWNPGLSHAVMDNFNFQSGSFPAMPQPWATGHAGMVAPCSASFAGMDIKQEHLNASTLRATSRTSTDSTATARASQSSASSFQSWGPGQGHVGPAMQYSVNGAGLEFMMEHPDGPAHYATSGTSAESPTTAMASPSSTTSFHCDPGSVGGSSFPAHRAVAGTHFGTSSSVPEGTHFAAHGPRVPQGSAQLQSALELPVVQAHGPSLASLQRCAEGSAQGGGQELGQTPAAAASPPNLGSRLHHIGLHVAQGLGEEHGQMPAPAANPTNLGSRVHHIGSCTPCKFFRSRRGCKEEDRCMLCHHPHMELTYSSMQRTMKQRSWMKRQLAQEARVISPAAPMNAGNVMAV